MSGFSSNPTRAGLVTRIDENGVNEEVMSKTRFQGLIYKNFERKRALVKNPRAKA